MSPELLAAANDAIDSQRESILASRDQSRQQADAAAAEQGPQVGNTPSPAGGEWADGSPHSDKLSGYPRMDIHNLLTLPTPLSNPFREMAAHPAIVQRLNWIQGPGFKLNTLGFTIVSERGCGGQALHANGTPLCKQRAPQPKDPAAEPRCCLAGGAVNAFDLHDGRFHAGSLNVAWQLHDVDKEQDGGFVVYVSRLRSTLRARNCWQKTTLLRAESQAATKLRTLARRRTPATRASTSSAWCSRASAPATPSSSWAPPRHTAHGL